MTDLDMAPDPFLNHGTEIPPSELPYREDYETDTLSLALKTKKRCCSLVDTLPGFRSLAKRLRYRR